jgi:acetyl esterase/lipase
VNLKVMSLLPGFRYSSVAAADPAEVAPGDRLVVEVMPQIPARPAGLQLRRGVSYGGGQRLDLLTPSAAGRLPLVVYLPGGGFVAAPRGAARRERGFIAAAGYAVASVTYRTIRQHATYADALADIRAAVSHLTQQADQYGIEPGRIAVWGQSAGGYLASLAGLSDPSVAAVVDQFGASDLSHAADGFDQRMHAALARPSHPFRRYGAIEANQIDLIRPGAPAFLILHGDDDRIIPPAQTLALHEALRAAGADSTRYLLAGAGHGPLALSRAQARQWTSVQVMTIIKDFLRHHLHC